jgi:NhaA family Na+:H+ antiporter
MKLPFTARPKELNLLSLAGLSAAAGIGFTVALFIANLAYEDQQLFTDQSKIGILFASLAAGVIGLFFLHLGTKSKIKTYDSGSE